MSTYFHCITSSDEILESFPDLVLPLPVHEPAVESSLSSSNHRLEPAIDSSLSLSISRILIRRSSRAT